MYARMVSFVVKPFQVKKFCNCVDEIAKNIATKQPGFVEHVVLISEEEKRLVTVLSMWQRKADADRYQEEVFLAALAKLKSMVDSGPVIQHHTALVPDSSPLRLKLSAAAA